MRSLLLVVARGLRTSSGFSGPLCAANGRLNQPLRRPHPRTTEEFNESLATPPRREGKFIRVAIVGEPNVGKSTIINKLIATDVCPVSTKAHTTRSANVAAMTTGQLQMVLVDTPGAVGRIHARRHHLSDAMVAAPSKALEKPIDVLAVVVDASDGWRRDFLSTEVATLLEEHRRSFPNACSILILNKVDRLRSKRQLLKCVESLCEGIVDNSVIPTQKTVTKHNTPNIKQRIWEKEERRRESGNLEVASCGKIEPPDPGTFNPEFPPRYSSWPFFSRVFMVSALKNDGIDELREYLEERSRYAVWECRPDLVYDQNPRELAQDITRERLLDNLRDEIPYMVKPRVTYWNLDESGNVLHIHISIECNNERQVRAVLGSGGHRIGKVTQQIRQRLCNVFQCEIVLKIGAVNKKAPLKPQTGRAPQRNPNEKQSDPSIETDPFE